MKPLDRNRALHKCSRGLHPACGVRNGNITDLQRSARGSAAGVAVLEFAVAVFVFLMMLVGTMIFAVAIWQYNIVAAAARDGARWAAVRGSTSTSEATTSTVEDYVEGRVYGLPVTITTTWPDSGSKDPGKRVRVQVATTFTPFTKLVPSGSITLDSTAEMYILR